MKTKVFTGPGNVAYIVPEEEVQDIDNESDWKLAEIKYRHFVLKEI